MSEADTLVQQAAAAYKAGQKEWARELAMKAIEKNERHEQAWLWLSVLVDEPEEKLICLENVLTINPANERARQEVARINQKLASQASPPPPPLPPSASNLFGDPFAPPTSPVSPQAPAPPSTGFGEFNWPEAGVSAIEPLAKPQPTQSSAFDSWSGSSFEQPRQPDQPDPFASATSVDWVREGPAVYGSGKKVELPSEQEYDDWLQGLNLPTDAFGGSGSPKSEHTSPFIVDASAPFGDTSFMAESDPFASTRQPASQAQDDSFGAATFGEESSPWDSPPTSPASPGPSFGLDSSPFGTSPAQAGFADQDAGSPFVGAFEQDEDEPFGSSFGPGEPTAVSPGFDFDEEDGVLDDGWLGSRLGGAPATAPPVFATPAAEKRPTKPLARSEDFSRFIPPEIEPKAGGFSRREITMLAGVIALAVLDLAALGLLLTAL